MRSADVTAAILALALAGCGERKDGTPPSKAPKTAAWHEVSEASLTDAQKAQRAKADEARQALFGFLSARLQKEIADSGPAAAVSVCKTDAKKIASDVSVSKGVTIGRTSFRLRNPANEGPEWTKPYVAARREKPAVLAHDDGRLALLHPIRLLTTCLVCHGDATTIAPEVQAILAKEYPADQATGFKENDLRGWFWVEVPKP